MVEKTLKSAIANAENNNDLHAGDLVVLEAVVGEGPTAKRFQPRARGSAGRILKRSSHIRIVVTDEVEIKTRESRKKTVAKSKKTSKKNVPQKSQPKQAEVKTEEASKE